MSQNIKLQKVMVYGVIVKMGGNNIRRHIICRMLHRRKGMNLLSVRQHHNTAGMLPRRTPHPDTALNYPVNFTVALMAPMLFKIIFHIAEGRLISQGSDGPGPEGLSGAEYHFRVFMGL